MSRYFAVFVKVLYMSLFCGIALSIGQLSSSRHAFILHNVYLCVAISAYSFRGNGTEIT